MDKEERKFHNDNKKIFNFVKSKHWPLVRDAIYQRIEDIQSVMNVDGLTAEEVFIDIKVRKLLATELLDLIRSIEGQAMQYEQNELNPDESEVSYILRQEDDE